MYITKNIIIKLLQTAMYKKKLQMHNGYKISLLPSENIIMCKICCNSYINQY